MTREGKRKVPVRLCKNGASLPLWPVPHFWHVRMRFSLILYIDSYLYSRKRKERENGLCAGKHRYTHGAYFNKSYIVSVRHFVYIFFLTQLLVKYSSLGGRMWFECHDWRTLKKICRPCSILVQAEFWSVRGATQKFGEFKQGVRTRCPMPFHR
jgi:hypothetical protein